MVKCKLTEKDLMRAEEFKAAVKNVRNIDNIPPTTGGASAAYMKGVVDLAETLGLPTKVVRKYRKLYDDEFIGSSG